MRVRFEMEEAFVAAAMGVCLSRAEGFSGDCVSVFELVKQLAQVFFAGL